MTVKHWTEADYYRASRRARAAWEATQPQLTLFTVHVFSERDVRIISYAFGSLASACSWLDTYTPPEGGYTEIEKVTR